MTQVNYKWLTELLVLVSGLFDTYLNYRSYSKTERQRTIPEKVKLVDSLKIDETEYLQNRAYNLDKQKFEFLKSFFELIFVLLLLQLDYFSLVWNELSGLYPGVYKAAFLFIVVEQLRSVLVELPFSYYYTFTIEQRHGFNKTTLNTFVTDRVKSFFLSVLFQFLFFGALIYCMETFREKFIVFSWIAAVVLCCLYLLLYPSYIAPLFNTFEGLSENNPKEAAIKKELTELCQRLKFPLGHLYKIDGSRRSDHSQAYFYGFFGKKQIVIFDTLISKAEVSEVVAVVGHELGHWRHKHNIQMIAMSFANIGFILWTFSFMINNDQMYSDFGFASKSYFMGLNMFFLTYSPLVIIVNALFCLVIRSNEYQADRFAVSLGFGTELLSALLKLFKDNKADLDPDELVALFRHTHPNLVDRTQALKTALRKET